MARTDNETAADHVSAQQRQQRMKRAFQNARKPVSYSADRELLSKIQNSPNLLSKEQIGK